MLLFSLRPATISGIDQGTIMSRKSRSSSVLCRVVSRHPIFTRAFMKKNATDEANCWRQLEVQPCKAGRCKGTDFDLSGDREVCARSVPRFVYYYCFFFQIFKWKSK